jgi:hypothetical protein
MKVLLDLDRLLADGEISAEQHARLRERAAGDTAALGYGLLAGFGVVAVAAATIALVPSAVTALLLGLGIAGLGLLVHAVAGKRWRLLAELWIVMGALLAAGGLVLADDGSAAAFGGSALLLGGLGAIVRSHLLTVLAVLALASALGARGAYFHASYLLGIEAPTLTALLFAVFALIAFRLHLRLPAASSGLALTAARTGVFLVNFALWVGSLFGDHFQIGATVTVPALGFVVVWALALLGAGAWGWHTGRRWLVNLCAVFGAIHFLTQWFERLGAAPWSVLVAGLLVLGFALGLRGLTRDAGNTA